MVFSTTSKYPVSNSKNVVSLVEMTKILNTWEPKVAKIKHTRNENVQNFTHQNKTTLFWRKKAKINLHQNFPIYGILQFKFQRASGEISISLLTELPSLNKEFIVIIIIIKGDNHSVLYYMFKLLLKKFFE